MKLTPAQQAQYEKEGYLLLPSVFSPEEIETFNKELPTLIQNATIGKMVEEDEETIRGIHGCHLNSAIIDRLTRHPSLLEPAKQLLGTEVYIHQCKINLKQGFLGGAWPWHQDFTHWHLEDGLPRDTAVNATLFLDAATTFNGCMYVIPTSHQVDGVLAARSMTVTGRKVAHHTDIEHPLALELVTEMIEKQGYRAIEAPAGSILFFHANLMHASGSNISPSDRRMLFVTYNDWQNRPTRETAERPSQIVGRNFEPLQPLL